MIGFPPAVDGIAGDVLVVEFLFVEYLAVDFLLSFVFTHDFEENGAIAVQDFICFANGCGGSTPELDVVAVFAGDGAEFFSVAAGDRAFADGADAGRGRHGWNDRRGNGGKMIGNKKL